MDLHYYWIVSSMKPRRKSERERNRKLLDENFCLLDGGSSLLVVDMVTRYEKMIFVVFVMIRSLMGVQRKDSL